LIHSFENENKSDVLIYSYSKQNRNAMDSSLDSDHLVICNAIVLLLPLLLIKLYVLYIVVAKDA